MYTCIYIYTHILQCRTLQNALAASQDERSRTCVEGVRKFFAFYCIPRNAVCCKTCLRRRRTRALGPVYIYICSFIHIYLHVYFKTCLRRRKTRALGRVYIYICSLIHIHLHVYFKTCLRRRRTRALGRVYRG